MCRGFKIYFVDELFFSRDICTNRVSLMSRNRADTTSEIPLELPQSSMPSPRKDNLLERGLMFLLSFLLVRLIDDKVFREEAMGELRFNFDGFCKVTKVLLRSAGARPETIKIKIVALLKLLMPMKVINF